MIPKKINLSQPTIFPELNLKENQPENKERESLNLTPLKYKHFREITKIAEQDQTHYLMQITTGLSDTDIGELYPDDAANISAIVYHSLKKYIELGKEVMQNIQD